MECRTVAEHVHSVSFTEKQMFGVLVAESASLYHLLKFDPTFFEYIETNFSNYCPTETIYNVHIMVLFKIILV